MSADVQAIDFEIAPVAAQAEKGVSLGRDAWRRLRRNRMAMLSLATLITIVLLAFLTPLLPLAAPDKHHTDLQYEPPKLWPLFVDTFSLDWKAIDETPARLQSVYKDLDLAKMRFAEAKQADPSGESKEFKKAENE